jgi:hypothetical protein
MKDLDSSAAATGGGVFGYFDATNNRVIVTYSGVPAAGTTELNTLQIAIYGSGKIEMIIGPCRHRHRLHRRSWAPWESRPGKRKRAISGRRPSASAHSEAAPVFHSFGANGAIYEQYYGGIQGSCGREGDEGQDD